MNSRPPVVYVDVEFTTLDPEHRRPWEIAIIRDDHTRLSEHVYFISDVDLTHANPEALAIGRFHERHPRANPDGRLNGALYRTEAQTAPDIHTLTRDAQWVGIVPSEDALTIAAMLRRHHLTPAWHYQLIDAAIHAAGTLGIFPPLSAWDVSAQLGIDPNQYTIHQALDDARWANDLLAVSRHASPLPTTRRVSTTPPGR